MGDSVRAKFDLDCVCILLMDPEEMNLVVVGTSSMTREGWRSGSCTLVLD